MVWRNVDEGKVNVMNNEEPSDATGKVKRKPYKDRLPGFVTDVKDEGVGLGDVIKRATSTVGIRPCGGCERRAAALNRWFVFSHRNPR
jgi:hypothetical protein